MANATAVNVNRRSANAGSVANLANMGTGLIASAVAQNQNSYVASLNAIGQQYDTNMAIAQNAYDMASRSASASLESNSNSINTSLANAQMANATAVNVNRRSANAGSVANLANMGTGLIAREVEQNKM